MPAVYYQSRQEAGQKAIEAFMQFKDQPLAIVSLDTDALVIGAQLSQAFSCPLQLFVATTVDVPGGVRLGSVNTEGGFSYNSNLSGGEADYFYQEFHGYIEDAKRTAFSTINREMGNSEVLRKDLLTGRNIIVVSDCLTDTAPLDSFLAYLKSVAYSKMYICAPIVKAELISHLRQVGDYVYFAGDVDYFYGKDHYFEDNSVYDKKEGINMVSSYLQLWPRTT
jgi:predicted phosphoribosyltransferase